MSIRDFVEGRGYDNTQSLAVPAGTTVTLISERITTAELLLLTHFANYVSDIMAWGSIVWNTTINGVPVASLYNVKDQLGDPANPRELGYQPQLRGNDLLEVKVTNNAAVEYSVGVSVKGKFGWER
jgi:hypothetical protein